MLFSTPQAGVGLEGGFFNSLNSTAITAFDINGNVLGSVTNNQIGIEFLGLVTNDGSSLISGLLFSLVGPELAGFTIDDVRFGIAGQVVVPGPGTVPLPAALPLFTTGLGALGLLGWRRKKKAAALAV